MTATVVVPEQNCPYKFLDYFEECDRATLGGRDQDALEWASRLAYHRACVLYAKSGLGKTSLLLAGVFPLLRERGCQPVYVRTLTDPTKDLLTSVCNECGVSTSSVQDLNTVLRKASNRRTVVIVFDQFEEFFIRFEGAPAGRDAFIKAISEAVDDPTLDIRILFSLREDYLARMNDFDRYLPALLDKAYQLQPLTAFGVRQAVTRPLIQAGIDYDQRLVASLVDELAPFGFDPPLLQIICAEVYRQATARTSGNVGLSESDLRQVGGIEGIFKKYLNAATSDISPEHNLVLRTVLDALITVERTKQAVTLDALLKGDFIASAEEVSAVLSLLVRQRVVRKERRGSDDWYELIHERLVPVILKWLELDQEFFEFRLAKQLVDNCSSGEAWREQPEALLNEGQLRGVVGPHKERLQLDELQSEFVLRSALYRGCEDAGYWADRYGRDRSLQVLLSLLFSEDDAVRLGAALSARYLADQGGRLAKTCLERSLEDPNESVRRAAGGSLASLAQQEHLEALKQARARRATRRNATEVLADLLAQKQTLTEFSRYSRWRAELIARRRAAWSNIRTLQKESWDGAVGGLLAAVFWTLTVFAGLAALTSWAFGLGTGGLLLCCAVLGIATVVCLLIAMPLGALIGWHSATSLTRDFLWSSTIRWGHTIRHDWLLRLLVFAAGILFFLIVLFGYSVEFVVVSSLGLSAAGTYLIGFLNRKLRQGHAIRHPWGVGILLFLISVNLFLLVFPKSYRGIDFGDLAGRNLVSLVVCVICGIAGKIVGAIGLSVPTAHLVSLIVAAYMSLSLSLIPSVVTRVGRWKWAFVGCVGLPLLIPALVTTMVVPVVPLLGSMGIVEQSDDFAVMSIIGAAFVALLGSLCSLTMTVVMARNASHLQPASSRASLSAVRGRCLAVALPLAFIIWYIGLIGYDTIPMLAKSIPMSPGQRHHIVGHLRAIWPDTDYFRMRLSPRHGARSPQAVLLTSSSSTLVNIGDTYFGFYGSRTAVATFYGQSQMLSLSSWDSSQDSDYDYDVSITSVPLVELQQNQDGQRTHQGIYLRRGKMSLAICRLTYREQEEITSESNPAARIWWQGEFGGQNRDFANGQFAMFLPNCGPKLAKLPAVGCRLQAVTERGSQEPNAAVVGSYTYFRRVAELSWGTYNGKWTTVPVNDEGRWKFKLTFELPDPVPFPPSGRRKPMEKPWELFGFPEFVDIIVGFSSDANPDEICWPRQSDARDQ